MSRWQWYRAAVKACLKGHHGFSEPDARRLMQAELSRVGSMYRHGFLVEECADRIADDNAERVAEHDEAIAEREL